MTNLLMNKINPKVKGKPLEFDLKIAQLLLNNFNEGQLESYFGFKRDINFKNFPDHKELKAICDLKTQPDVKLKLAQILSNCKKDDREDDRDNAFTYIKTGKIKVLKKDCCRPKYTTITVSKETLASFHVSSAKKLISTTDRSTNKKQILKLAHTPFAKHNSPNSVDFNDLLAQAIKCYDSLPNKDFLVKYQKTNPKGFYSLFKDSTTPPLQLKTNADMLKNDAMAKNYLTVGERIKGFPRLQAASILSSNVKPDDLSVKIDSLSEHGQLMALKHHPNPGLILELDNPSTLFEGGRDDMTQHIKSHVLFADTKEKLNLAMSHDAFLSRKSNHFIRQILRNSEREFKTIMETYQSLKEKQQKEIDKHDTPIEILKLDKNIKDVFDGDTMKLEYQYATTTEGALRIKENYETFKKKPEDFCRQLAILPDNKFQERLNARKTVSTDPEWPGLKKAPQLPNMNSKNRQLYVKHNERRFITNNLWLLLTSLPSESMEKTIHNLINLDKSPKLRTNIIKEIEKDIEKLFLLLLDEDDFNNFIEIMDRNRSKNIAETSTQFLNQILEQKFNLSTSESEKLKGLSRNFKALFLTDPTLVEELVEENPQNLQSDELEFFRQITTSSNRY